MRSLDKYTGSSDSDSDEGENRGRSAQAIHNGVLTRHTVEYVPEPPPAPEPPPPMLRLPSLERAFEGTLIVPHEEDDDDAEDADEAKESTDDRQPQPVIPIPRVPRNVIEMSPQAPLVQSAGRGPEQPIAVSPPEVPEMREPSERSEAELPAEGLAMLGDTGFEQLAVANNIDSESYLLQHSPMAEGDAAVGETRQPQSSIHRSAPAHNNFTPLPPMPPLPGNTGNQPPSPPTNVPPRTPDFNNAGSYNTPPPNVPGVHRSAGGGGHPHGFEQPAAPPPVYNYNVQNVQNRYFKGGGDGWARLGVIGTFFGYRRARKKTREEIVQNRKDADANFADIQAQQMRFEHQQRSQAKEMQKLQHQASATGLVAAAEHRPTQTVTVPSAEYHPDASTVPPIPDMPRVEQLPPIRGIARADSVVVPTQHSDHASMLASSSEQHPTSPADAMRPRELRPNEHLDRSNLPNTILDDRGRPVGDIHDYGQDFQRNRKEVFPGNSLPKGAAASLGGMAVSSPQSGYHSGALPSGMASSPHAASGQLTANPAQSQQPADSRTSDKAVPGPVFWVMLVVIVAAFFAAALI